ncbi:hypothetical protein ATANTOWER_021252 [Ataeniobius toweri]|uniref:TNFR-Cys domain-containing protein n=1 Tax=Ataeniobius toweri TaxID=208326 RepID=A0ABU7BUY4_9TELE|nr:hypothetical protein [Ataeniobius toweri]
MSTRIMKSNPAMKLIVLFTASFSWAFQQQAVPPKYQYRDPVTSQVRSCDQCPPGTSVKRHCTAETPTECQPCPERHFAENWHWGDMCQYCTSVCKERQLVKQQCNSTHDQLCECEPGYHLVVEFCIAHSTCPPGYGVKALDIPISEIISLQRFLVRSSLQRSPPITSGLVGPAHLSLLSFPALMQAALILFTSRK